jgi:hypothetical protein
MCEMTAATSTGEIVRKNAKDALSAGSQAYCPTDINPITLLIGPILLADTEGNIVNE